MANRSISRAALLSALSGSLMACASLASPETSATPSSPDDIDANVAATMTGFKQFPDGSYEFEGWLLKLGAEWMIYPRRTDVGQQFLGTCVSAAPNFDGSEAAARRLSGHKVRVTGAALDANEWAGIPHGPVQNFCALPVIMIIGSAQPIN